MKFFEGEFGLYRQVKQIREPIIVLIAHGLLLKSICWEYEQQ